MTTITYRTLGPWGGGKGANLQPSEVDANFYSLAQAIFNIENNPAEPNGIATITVSGTQMTIYLTNGEVMGPFTLPVLTFRWRGEFDPGTPYAVLDVFTFTEGNPTPATTQRYGIFMVQVAGSWSVFDPDLVVGDTPAYLHLFGSTTTLLSTLGDVAVDEPPGSNPLSEGDVLRWRIATDKWENEHLGTMALQDGNNVLITGGQIHNMSMPVDPGDVVNKAYVDALPAGMTIDSPRMMANISGLTGPAMPQTLSDFLDTALATTVRGTMLYRGAPGWISLPPGDAGLFLQTAGAGADPSWQLGGSGVTSIDAGPGIDTGGAAIIDTGTISLAEIGDDTFLANIAGASGVPSATSLTSFLDSVLGTARGTIVTRTIGGWVSLSPGLTGQFLKTQGSGADLIWDSPVGSGTVTSISAGTGITTGGSPITSTGSVALATIATNTVLANTSVSTAAPIATTPTLLLDRAFGTTQGAVLYRSNTAWVILAPGTLGQFLATGGAAANPSWQNAPITGSSTPNLHIVSNVSGSTAVPTGNTLTNILDAIISSARGTLLYRTNSGWVGLAPGTSGQVLQTGGAAGDPHWAAGGGGGSSITVSDTPPASPSPGDAWWDGVSGNLYIRVDDGTSVQWAPASNQPGPIGPTGATGPAGTNGTNANISGLTTGQIGIAGSATSITSSIPTSTFLATAGGTMTGNLTIATAGINNSEFNLNKPDGTVHNLIIGKNAGNNRWTMGLGDNAGDNFNVSRWNDAGGYVDTPLTISRATGNVGLGVAPSAKLHVTGTGPGPVPLNTSGVLPHSLLLSDTLATAGAGGQIVFAAGGDGWRFAAISGWATNATGNTTGDLVFYTRAGFGDVALTEQMRICDLGVVFGNPAGGPKGLGTINAVTVYGNGVALTSDATLKTDIEPLSTPCLPLVAAIRPQTYRWREPDDDRNLVPDGWAERRHSGFLAQDLADAAGELPGIVEGKPGDGMAVDVGAMLAVLWQAVRELSAKVETLEAAK